MSPRPRTLGGQKSALNSSDERFTGIQNCGKTINQTCNKGSQAILRKVNPAQKPKKEELPRFIAIAHILHQFSGPPFSQITVPF